ncbi:hypothetical protein MHEI_36320 [Mycobacterium heidelbergense]|nr:hypothetical protein MHEI_36320 [Mycobacterium heidelbergense]
MVGIRLAFADALENHRPVFVAVPDASLRPDVHMPDRLVRNVPTVTARRPPWEVGTG